MTEQSYFKHPNAKGDVFILAVDKKFLEAEADKLAQSIGSLWDSASRLIVGGVLHCVEHSYDTSLIRKALVCMEGNASMYKASASLLKELGFEVDYEGSADKKESVNNKTVVRSGTVKKNLADTDKAKKFWTSLWECAYGDGLKAKSAKVKKTPKSANAGKGNEKGSNVISRTAGEQVAIDTGVADVLTKATEVDSEHTKKIMELAEPLIEELLKCSDYGQVKGYILGQVDKLQKQPKLSAMVDKLAKAQDKAA